MIISQEEFSQYVLITQHQSMSKTQPLKLVEAVVKSAEDFDIDVECAGRLLTPDVVERLRQEAIEDRTLREKRLTVSLKEFIKS